MAQERDELLGIEIGGTKLQIVIGNADGCIVDRWRGSVAREQGRVGICRQLAEALGAMLQKHPAHAVGVGFGGPVDWRSGRTIVSHQIEGWDDFDLGGWLHQTTGLPVALDNDANVAALGESTRGAGRDFDPVFYVTLGSGVGGGCVVGGSIYHGAQPGEAEFGHLRLNRQGDTVEHCCSGWAVDRRLREAAALQPGGSLAHRLGSATSGEAKHLAAAVSDQDPAALKILADVAGDLAFGLSHVVHLFHPAVIVIGGGLSMVGEPLLSAVEAALPAQIVKAFAPGPQIRPAALGEDAVPVGALRLARSALSRSTL